MGGGAASRKDYIAQGRNLNPGMTSKARLPGLFQDNYHSLAGHLSPSLQDEAGTVLILKKEKQVWRGLHMGLAYLVPSEGLSSSGPQGPSSPDLGLRGQLKDPTHNQDPTVTIS